MAHIIYKIKKKVVPSVTTVLGRYKDSQGLLYWSNSLGLKGISYSKFMKEAGNIGTNVHELAQSHIEGLEYDLHGYDDVVTNCMNKFLNWWEDFKSENFEVIFCEQSFTSKKHKYGGTADLLVKKNDEYILVDFKTSKYVYSDYLIQGSAYKEMIEEKYDYPITKFIVARFGKENDDFEIKTFNQKHLEVAFSYFKTLRKAFDQDKKLTQLIKEIK
jgi:hypothetical protein